MSLYSLASRINSVEYSVDELSNKADSNNAVLSGTTTFTGPVNGITKSMVGLGDVDNTADASKPVSTATLTALNAKADKSTTYTMSEVDTKISNLAAGAPDALENAE